MTKQDQIILKPYYFYQTQLYKLQVSVLKTQRSVSYLDFHLEIDKEVILKKKLYDTRDDFTLPIVNFPFISSSIPVTTGYGVYISQLLYSRTCAQYCDFQDRTQLGTQKLLKQWYITPRWKSSLQNLYRGHHKKSISCKKPQLSFLHMHMSSPPVFVLSVLLIFLCYDLAFFAFILYHVTNIANVTELSISDWFFVFSNFYLWYITTYDSLLYRGG